MSPLRRRVLRRGARRVRRRARPRVLRRTGRRVLRRTGRRVLRRTTRRIRRRTRRLIVGAGAILLIGGTATAIKLARRDIRRIETHTGRSADNLTEGELLDAMERLGIQRLELTPDDNAAIEEADAEEVG